MGSALEAFSDFVNATGPSFVGSASEIINEAVKRTYTLDRLLAKQPRKRIRRGSEQFDADLYVNARLNAGADTLFDEYSRKSLVPIDWGWAGEPEEKRRPYRDSVRQKMTAQYVDWLLLSMDESGRPHEGLGVRPSLPPSFRGRTSTTPPRDTLDDGCLRVGCQDPAYAEQPTYMGRSLDSFTVEELGGIFRHLGIPGYSLWNAIRPAEEYVIPPSLPTVNIARVGQRREMALKDGEFALHSEPRMLTGGMVWTDQEIDGPGLNDTARFHKFKELKRWKEEALLRDLVRKIEKDLWGSMLVCEEGVKEAEERGTGVFAFVQPDDFEVVVGHCEKSEPYDLPHHHARGLSLDIHYNIICRSRARQGIIMPRETIVVREEYTEARTVS